MTTTVLAFIPSPSQGVWHLGPFPVRAYALCIIAGIIAALVLGDRRWEARGGERGVIYDIALWAVPFGLIGGRLYHVMTDASKYFGPDGAGFVAALRIWDGGLGIWGAVALGGVGAWIACKRRGIPLPAFGDAIAPGIILAQAIGRLGNYFNQELYGRETDLPWGLKIYDRLDPTGVVSPHSLDGVSTGQVFAIVHPTFLYELIWNLLIFVLLLWADRRFKLGHGRLFALYVAGYCVGRFWVELMRSDTATLIAGIRVNTFTSTFVFIAAVIYIMVAPKGREDPKTLRGKDADVSVLDDLGEELVAVAATSGVVAAAKVAGDEDKTETAPRSTESEAAAEAEDLTEQVETAPSADIAEAEKFAAAGEAPEGGLGAVEGDDALAAEVAAPEVHEAAVEAADEAQAVADDMAAEDDAAQVHEAAVEAEPVAEESADEAAVENADTADAVAAEVAAGEPEAGLGSVDRDEVAAAEDDAAEVHEAAVEATEDAESVADEVAAESESGESSAEADGESADTSEPEGGVGAVEGDDAVAAEEAAAEVHEAAVEHAEDADAVAAEVAAGEPEAGLGSVDGDEVAAAEDDAAEVHEAAIEATEDAESVADEVAAESEPEESSADAAEPEADEPAGEPEAGLGSVEGDEVAAAEDDAAEVHEAAVEGAKDAEAAPEEVAQQPAPSGAATQASAQPRRRWWRRR